MDWITLVLKIWKERGHKSRKKRSQGGDNTEDYCLESYLPVSRFCFIFGKKLKLTALSVQESKYCIKTRNQAIVHLHWNNPPASALLTINNAKHCGYPNSTVPKPPDSSHFTCHIHQWLIVQCLLHTDSRTAHQLTHCYPFQPIPFIQ